MMTLSIYCPRILEKIVPAKRKQANQIPLVIFYPWSYINTSYTLKGRQNWNAKQLDLLCKEGPSISHFFQGTIFNRNYSRVQNIRRTHEFFGCQRGRWHLKRPLARDKMQTRPMELAKPKIDVVAVEALLQYIHLKEQSDPHIRVMSSRLGLEWDRGKFIPLIFPTKSLPV